MSADDRLSTLGGLKLKLAAWLPEREQYQRRYMPVDFNSERESGNRNVLAAVPQFRPFSMRSWVGGEGITWWEPDLFQYRESTNVRPVRLRDGLELGALSSVTTKGGSAFNNGQQFGLAIGKLFTAGNGALSPLEVYPWDLTVPDWDNTLLTPAAIGSDDRITSIVQNGKSALGVLIASDDGSGSGVIYPAPTGAGFPSNDDNLFYNDGTGDDDPFLYPPVLRMFDGVVYALDGDDLYALGTPGVRTQVVDLVSWTSDNYLDQTPWSYNRMSTSDKGPIWITRIDNGATFLWEYDVNDDVQRKIGKLPVDFAFPYSIYFSKGFTFVAFRYAPSHTESGEAYIWFKRGAQDGVIGPVRAPSGVTASKPILLAGVIGDDLVFYFDGAIWAYNMSYGGVYQIATQETTGTPYGAITFGKDVFIAPVTNSSNTRSVERFDTTRYATDGTIDLGKHDWDYPGIEKILLDVTVVTDPLPANCRVSLFISVDGDDFVGVTSPAQYHQNDDATKFTWVASTSGGTTLAGNEFEIRLMLESSTSTATPTIREVTARAKAAAHLLEITMQIDAGTIDTGEGFQTSEALIAGLNALCEADPKTVTSFTDMFQTLETSTPPAAFDVTVQDVATPMVETGEQEDEASAVVILHAVNLV